MRDISKKLSIINTGERKKTSESSVTTQYISGGGDSIGGGNFLPKQTWDKVFEIRTTDGGEEYLFSKLNFVLQYGLTAFADVGNLDLPDIYDGLKIDNQTIYWAEVLDENGNVTKVLKAKGGGGEAGGGSIEYPLSWSGFSSGSWDGSSAKNIYIPSKVSELTNDSNFIPVSALNDYATKSWVNSNFLPLSGGTITGDLTVNNIIYSNTIRSRYNRWMMGDDGSTRQTFGGNYTGSSTVINGNKVNIYANDVEIADIDSGGVTFRKRTWCTESSVALYFQSLTACATGANTTGAFRMGQFDESDGGFKMQFGGTGTSGQFQIVDQSWSKALFKVDKSGNGYFAGGLKLNQSAWDNGLKINRTASGGGAAISVYSTDTYIGCLGINGEKRFEFSPVVNGASTVRFAVDSSGNGDFAGYITCKGNLGIGGVSGVNTSINLYSYDNSGYQFSNRITDGKMLRIYYRSSAGQFTNVMELGTTGNLLVTGGITMYGTSDKRLKKNIRIFSASEELMKLGGVYQFEYNDDEIKRNESYKGTHIGLIYQNVKGTILDKMCYQREDGFGSLNYLDTSFISLLAAVGIEHETRLQKLERENEELKKEVEQLKNR